jgi:hypothetical protein
MQKLYGYAPKYQPTELFQTAYMREVIKRLKMPIRNEEYPLPWADIRKLDSLRSPFRGALPGTSTVGRALGPKLSLAERRPKKPQDSSRDSRAFIESAKRKPTASSSEVEDRRGHSQDKRGRKMRKIVSEPEDQDDDESLGEEVHRGRSRDKRGRNKAKPVQETDDENDDDILEQEEVSD